MLCDETVNCFYIKAEKAGKAFFRSHEILFAFKFKPSACCRVLVNEKLFFEFSSHVTWNVQVVFVAQESKWTVKRELIIDVDRLCSGGRLTVYFASALSFITQAAKKKWKCCYWASFSFFSDFGLVGFRIRMLKKRKNIEREKSVNCDCENIAVFESTTNDTYKRYSSAGWRDHRNSTIGAFVLVQYRHSLRHRMMSRRESDETS